MRIAIFSECYTPVTNGVVTSVRTLRDTLRNWGHDVFLFAPGVAQPEDDEQVFRLPDLPFPRHPYHFARPFPRLHFDFASLGAQVVHCQHPFTVGRLGAELARRYDLPMVYTAHSLYDTMAAAARSSLVRNVGQPYARGIVRRFCASATCVIVPSRYTRDALVEAGVRAEFEVVPSGVTAPDITREGRNSIRERLGLQEQTPLLIYIGRLGPEKRVDMLLNAVAILKERRLLIPYADFRVAIVGDGQCRAALESMIVDLGIQDHVLFCGAQPYEATGAWYAAADLFLLPSPTETQGLVLVEAMAAGLCCVAVDAGGAREVVRQNGTGLLTKFAPEAFADAIQRLLLDAPLRRAMASAGPCRARIYSPTAMANSILKVYESATELHATGAERLTSRLKTRYTVVVKRRS